EAQARLAVLEGRRAVVVLDSPGVMRPWQGDQYRWDATFRETSGKSGFRVRSADFHIDTFDPARMPKGMPRALTKVEGITKPLWSEAVEVKPSGSADVHFTIGRIADTVQRQKVHTGGGKFHCVWVGEDDVGTPLEILQEVYIPEN